MNVLVTGSSGTIGKALENISANITPFDLPTNNALDIDQLADAARNQDAIIHLAWDVKSEHCGTEHTSDQIDPANTQMYLNTYEAAHRVGLKRVIMASSIHADNFIQPDKVPMLPSDNSYPHCAYGANKVFMERVGKAYAARGLGVICIRFGAVRADNNSSNIDPQERHVWLNHEDAVSLIDRALTAPLLGNYALVYGVSNNLGRIHSAENAIGWSPVSQADLLS